MVLLYIIISIVLFSLLFQILNNQILQKIFYVASVLLVLIIYFIFARNSYLPQFFYPSAEQNIRTTFYEKQQACKLDSKYKPLLNSILKGHVYLFTSDQYPKLKHPDIYKIYPTIASTDLDLYLMFDMSYYKDKIYLYFGIIPVVVFYLPYYFITKTFLSDQLLVFFICSFVFLLSLIVIKLMIKNLKLNLNYSMQVFSVFLIGFANGCLFLITRPEIYEVCIITASFFFLLAILFFLFYINKPGLKFIFFVALFLSLSVGCRPNYVIHIPVFLMFIIYFLKKEKFLSKQIYKNIFWFIIPCLIVGILLALYNFIRFDSVFQFGWKYQLNTYNAIVYNPSFKDFFIGLKTLFFKIPIINNEFPFFSMSRVCDHSLGIEYSISLFLLFPLTIFIFVFFLNKSFRQIKNNNFIIVRLLLISAVLNIIVVSFAGVIQRYIFEYLYIISILSVLFFIISYNNVNKKYKILFNSVFFIFFIFTIYMNISVVFAKNNYHYFAYTNPNFYNSVINFLK